MWECGNLSLSSDSFSNVFFKYDFLDRNKDLWKNIRHYIYMEEIDDTIFFYDDPMLSDCVDWINF